MADNGPKTFTVVVGIGEGDEVQFTVRGFSIPDALAGLFGLGLIHEKIPGLKTNAILSLSIREGTAQ